MASKKKITQAKTPVKKVKKLDKPSSLKQATVKKSSVKKPIVKKPVAKTSPAKKLAVKKPITKKPAVKKPASAKSVPKKPMLEKPVAKKSSGKKPALKKSAVKTTVAKKPAPEKPVAKKSSAKKPALNKSVAKKPSGKKPVPEKPVAKKSNDKKPVLDKSVFKKPALTNPAAKKPAVKKKVATAETAKAKKNAPKIISQVLKKSSKPATNVKAAAKKPSLFVATPLIIKSNLAELIPDYERQEEKIDTDYMHEEKKTHFRSLLSDWKKQLMQEVDRTVELMQEEAANFPDPADRATQEEEFNLELRARDRERKLLKKIVEALVRLDNDEYGYCEVCGVEIGYQRLIARPTATLCIDCKTIDEIRERQLIKND